MKSIVLAFLLVFNVSADLSNYEDNSDSDFDDIFDDFYDSVFGYNDKGSEHTDNEDEQPVFTNGTWMCGDCTNIDESKLVYSESLELETNDNFNEQIETQIGFALNNMRCITIKTDERNTIRRVTGSCVGDEVTLSVLAAFYTDIKIYG